MLINDELIHKSFPYRSSMKILFWNVWCFPKWITKSELTDIERATKIAELIKGYDVVLLCEAWTPAAKEILKKTYTYSYQTTHNFHVVYDSGLLILSNNKLQDLKSEVYNHAANWDWYAAKGILKCSVSISGVAYCIFLTHMQAGNNTLDQDARKNQTLQLINFCNREITQLKNNEEILLIGDLNIMPSMHDINNKRIQSPHCKDLEDNMLRSACFSMLLNETNFIDIKPDNDVFHFLKMGNANYSISYQSSNGLTDGPYVIISSD